MAMATGIEKFVAPTTVYSGNFSTGTSAAGLFHLALGSLHLPADARGGPGTLTFRPESVRIGHAAENTLTARIVDRTFMGTQTRLRLTAADPPFEAVTSPDLAEGLEIGSHLPVTLPRLSLWVMEQRTCRVQSLKKHEDKVASR